MKILRLLSLLLVLGLAVSAGCAQRSAETDTSQAPPLQDPDSPTEDSSSMI